MCASTGQLLRIIQLLVGSMYDCRTLLYVFECFDYGLWDYDVMMDDDSAPC